MLHSPKWRGERMGGYPLSPVALGKITLNNSVVTSNDSRSQIYAFDCVPIKCGNLFA